jgi:hypothetical protein
MTEYGHYITTQHKPTPLLSHDPIKEKKAARRKLLEEVEQRRVENYKRFLEKTKLQASSKIDTIA